MAKFWKAINESCVTSAEIDIKFIVFYAFIFFFTYRLAGPYLHFLHLL